MFVVLSGNARVALEPSGQEVAAIPPGGFFGEMSMLTGDRRSASVRAMEDVKALEIAAEDIRGLAQSKPGLLEHIARSSCPPRRPGACRSHRRSRAAGQQAPQNLLARIQRFLQL